MSRINSENSQMDQGAHVPVHHSNFDLSNNLYRTYRFGEYAPFFYIDSFEKDKCHQRNITTTRSLSLKAPLMEDINMKRDYFQVYYDALLPINWDKLYVRPKNGDIADWLLCSTNVPNFGKKVNDMCRPLISSFADSDLLAILDIFTFLEMFYSEGSLLNHFGCHLSPFFRAFWRPYQSPAVYRPQYTNFDKFFDGLMAVFTAYLTRYSSSSTLNAITYQLIDEPDDTHSVETATDLRLLLTYVREGSVSFVSADESLLTEVKSFLSAASLDISSIGGEFPLNLAPLWAYQICCAHFYSDDNVDYVFSAELFRSLVGSYIRDMFLDFSMFSYNGVLYQYDHMSSYYFQNFAVDVLDSGLNQVNSRYFRLLFGYNRSLRFQDYFAGARPRPIAVGNETEIAVNDGKVSVIDVTLSIQWQRLLNNIQRLPQEIGRHIQEATGQRQSFDYHNPGWLAHTKDTIFAAEVENTGSAQQTQPNSVTSTLRGKSGNKEFTFESDRPCIIIGIQYFDIRRAYYSGVRRTLMMESREDMFMPELQYIGDQPIHNVELVSDSELADFGYTEQYNWLKTNYDEAMGGFVNDSLPGWAFLFRPEFFRYNRRARTLHIGPNFIRSIAPELDDFFLSLTGFSLGTYFHFQQKVVNITNMSRNMVRHSQILQ